MTTAILKGSAESGLVKTVQSGEIASTPFGWKQTIIKRGSIANCNLALPLVWTVYENGAMVMQAYVRPVSNGLSDLVVETEYRKLTYIYEIDWQQVQTPISLNAYFSDLTVNDWTAINQAVDNKDGSSLTGLQVDAFTMLMQGDSSFFNFFPVCRRVTNNYMTLWTSGRLGQITAGQPFAGAPMGYNWLKTTERNRKDGAFVELTEEWLGTPNPPGWNANLYAS